MAVSAPEKLHFTGVDEADELLARDPFALLMGFALDQQVPVQTAFQGPLKLKQRLGTLDPGKIAATDPGKLEAIFRETPAIHRFPGNMARRVQDLASLVAEDYGGDASRVASGARRSPTQRFASSPRRRGSRSGSFESSACSSRRAGASPASRTRTTSFTQYRPARRRTNGCTKAPSAAAGFPCSRA